MKFFYTATLLVLFSQALPALADNGLYRDVADPDSSYVRVIAPGQTLAFIDGGTIQDISQGISGFVNVVAGEIEVGVPSGKGAISVEKSAYYTAIFLDEDTPVIVKDVVSNSPSKADISVYNLTDAPDVELFVPAANAVAVRGIDPNGGKSIAIKAPLTLDLELRSDGKTLATLSQVELIRRSGVSIVLVQNGGEYSAVATPNLYLK